MADGFHQALKIFFDEFACRPSPRHARAGNSTPRNVKRMKLRDIAGAFPKLGIGSDGVAE
jgi:hypothetical protein